MLFRLVHCHSRNPRELRELFVLRLLVFVLKLTQMDLAVCESLLAPGELRQLPVDLLFLGEDALLDLHHTCSMLGDFAVDLRTQRHGLLAGADLGLSPEGLRLSLRVLEELMAQLPRST